MVPVEPSSLRSDSVEPTKDDPEMLQRDTNNFNAINQCTDLCREMCEKLLASPYFGKMTFFGKNTILAKQCFGKMIAWDTHWPFSKKTQCAKRTGLQIGSRSNRNLNGRRITNPKVLDLYRKNSSRNIKSKRTRRNPNYVLLSLILID